MSASERRIMDLAGLWVLATACGSETTEDDACFAPDRNLDSAYTRGAVGCDCRPEVDKPVCVPDRTGRLVALICEGKKWIAVEDGPCWK